MRRTRPVDWLWLLWGGFVVYGTLLPFDFSWDAYDQARGSGSFRAASSLSDVVSNYLLFLPWGFLGAIALVRRGWNVVAAWSVPTLSGALLSATVEFLQQFTPTRVSQIEDVLRNSASAAAGALAGILTARLVLPRVAPRVKTMVATRPLAAFALGLAATLFVTQLTAFDFSIDMSSLKSSVKSARPIPFGAPVRGETPPFKPYKRAIELGTWILIGGAFALALREAGRSGPALGAGAGFLGGGLSAVSELSQLLIGTRTTDATTVLMAAVGSSFAGIVVACFPRAKARAFVGPALFVWLVTVMMDRWTPLDFAWFDPANQDPRLLLPFFVYFDNVDFRGLSDLLLEVISVMPLGFLLASRSARRTAGGAAVWGLLLGFVLQGVQYFHLDRTAEMTDVLAGGIGAALGVMLWRWAERVRTDAIAGRARSA